MATFKVVRGFRDKVERVHREVNDEFTATDERGKFLVDLGYVIEVKQEKAQVKTKEEKAVKATK